MDAVTSDPGWNGGEYGAAADVADGLRRHADLWAVMGLSTDFWKTEFWRGISPVVEVLGWSTSAEFQQNFIRLLFGLMENRRRGMFATLPMPIKAEVIDFARKCHGYLFSWAAIHTFWYHPMLNTSGHLIGFFYMFLILVQGSLFLTRAHTNRVWTLCLELLVAVHGTLVAIMNSGPNGIWPMFLFGFLAVLVITQMHGVGWSRRTRTLIGAGYVLAVVASYAWLGFGRVNEIVRIPIIEYALVAALSLLIWGGLAIARAVRRHRSPDPATSGDELEPAGPVKPTDDESVSA